MSYTKLTPEYTFTSDRIDALREMAPEVFVDGKIDFEILREVLGSNVEADATEHFGLNWPGKRSARRLATIPSNGTLIPMPGRGIAEDSTHNLFIEGDNLEVLKLLQKSYSRSVKMIYIDPPYNTGNDFIYEDDFSEPTEGYLRKSGQKGNKGELLTSNPKANGRFHSNWLNMMYPRLRLARTLLSEDGVIFVSIDDNEISNLKSLMNEIFGEEAFLSCFVWQRRQVADSRNDDRASTDHEYVLAYRGENAALRGKDIDLTKYTNPDEDPRGEWASDNLTGLANRENRPNLHYDVTDPDTGIVYPPSPARGWSISKENFEILIQEKRILWPAKPTGRPRLKRFLKDAKSLQTGFSSILKVGYTTDGTREIQDLFNEKVFPFPKPTTLIRTLIEQTACSDGDIILDFFAGSGTTAQATLEQCQLDGVARSFILVQIPEPLRNNEYPTISDITQERIKRVISSRAAKKSKQVALEYANLDLGFKMLKFADSNIRTWPGFEGQGVEDLQTTLDIYETPLKDTWTPESLFTEVLLIEGFPLDSEVETVEMNAEARQGHLVFNTFRVASSPARGHRLWTCFDTRVNPENVVDLGISAEDVLVCLDSALSDDSKIRFSQLCNLKTI